jgi:hypothetical protein
MMVFAGMGFGIEPQELIASPQPPIDSAEAIRHAWDLVAQHYYQMTPPRQPRPCSGITLDECRQGTWSCPLFCPSDIPERRVTLIDELDRLAPIAGNSQWLFQQRVGFAVKAGQVARAHAIASSCRDTDWWCLALRGYAEHLLRPGSGLASFDAAIVLMPEQERCAWKDLEAVVSPELFVAGGRPSCKDNAAVRAMFWWLADPLWSRDGNERLAEHYTRHVMHRINTDILDLYEAVAEGLSWRMSGVNRPLPPLRQGYTNSIRHVTRSTHVYRAVPGQRGDSVWRPVDWDVPVWYVYGGYSFVPDTLRFTRPLASKAVDWAVRWDQGEDRLITRETWHNLEHQTAVFRRGDRLLFVAAAPVATPLLEQQVQPSLALGRVEDMQTEVVPAVIDEHGAFRARAVVDSGGYLASIEVIGLEDVARARFGAPARPLVNGFGVSDLALVDASFEDDSLGLEDALLPAAIAARGEPIGVYFEVYGPSPDETLDVTLAAEKPNPSFFQRITRALRLSSATAFRLAWREPVELEDGIAKRFIVIDAGALSSGEHELSLRVRRADGTVIEVSRSLRLR